MYHVRLTPYDRHSGALCQRLSLGGQLFEARKWYTLHPEQGEKLRPLKQKTGAPHFQIIESDKEWRELVRQELAADMAGPEAAAMARFFSQQPQSLPSPKNPGEVVPSEFEGLTATVVGDDAAIGAATAELKSSTTTIPKGPPRRGRKAERQATLLEEEETESPPKKSTPKKSPAKRKSPPKRSARKKK